MTEIVYNNQGATRDRRLSRELERVLREAGARAGIDRIVVTSGGQTSSRDPHLEDVPGGWTGSTRHDHGQAGDMQLDVGGRILNFTKAADRALFSAFAQHAAALGATGIGAGLAYMGGTKIHVGFGTKATWAGVGAAPGWLKDAVNAGWANPTAFGAEALNETTNIGRGSPKAHIEALQTALKDAGFDPGTIDGKWGPRTKAAVERFQQAKGLDVDGIVGPDTIGAIGLNKPAALPQSKLSALDQLMKDVPPAPAMSMAPAVRPSLMAGVPPQTSASASISGPPSSAAGQFSPKPGIGLSLSAAQNPAQLRAVSSSFSPKPAIGRPETFGQAVPSGPDPRAAGLYAPTQAANPRIAGAFESLKGPSSLHLAADLMRKAQGIPATPPQSPFAGSPERPSVRAAVGDSPFAGTPERASLQPTAPAPMPSGVSRGWGGVTGAPLPSSMSPGPVQPRGPLQIGALVQDMRAAPKLASGRAPMDLNPGLAASQFHGGAASMPMSPDQRMLQSVPLGPYGVTGTHSPALKTSGQAMPQAPLAFTGGTFAPQARPATQISGMASPSPLAALASGSVSPRPVQPKGVGSLALSPEARPSLRPPALSRPPLPTVTAPMSFPSGSLPPLGPPEIIGTLPTVDVPLSPAPPPAPPPMAPPPSFAPPPMARPPVLPALPPLAMLGKPIGKAAGSLQDLLGGLFRGPGMVQAAIAAGNKGGKFSSKDFWDKFNSFPGSGKGGGAVGLEGMASYAAAREAGMGGREKSKSKGSGKKK